MNKITTRLWDSASHLRTEEEMAAYLEAALENREDDSKYLIHALDVIARAREKNQPAAGKMR
ncbi:MULTISPECIES: DNA-binding protein [unclassified Achromobacter]|uniref:helix-turn-helix domain-containing transcriptional regulator n=1 Tax=unclassified Achromobacter TaxID=2626865 RepID=UPI000B515C73|nr:MULTISPECIES: hypothetical protein [unclassified Achromobacter]OWT68120.1 hypothetical protein CEY05_29250 [Achromobacter sp. HZ34]OWT69957.1 hypothetical protein CEY04_28080 [Achromobacter sp. HZ28]